MRNNIIVVIPCYNAKRSIVLAINDVLRHMPDAGIIVVDDNSPDGSQNLIKANFSNNNNVKLIIRKNKEGRGSAVLRGFQEGLRNKNAQFFVEMDGDLCHKAKYIPSLIKMCRSHDVAIASKYLKESMIEGLNLKRKIFSKIANYFIKFTLRVPITDFTNGFRCYRRKALESIDLSSFHSKGFIVLSELAYKLHKKGNSFTEIPFDFEFKELNKSNFNWREIKEAFLTILKIRFSDNFKFRQRKNKMASGF